MSTARAHSPGSAGTREGTGARSSPPVLYTPAEAARLLKVPESWLRRQAGQRRVRCTYLGRHLRFSDADLHDIVATGTRPARAAGGRRTR
ncbi:helix-turn-helix domain-containing protein [Haloechinothrix halophila]|uniref:helix-turn-helix domain-containing protein n=1 Tax=Haloechinothrix halophila TaxID=1069073 RepID=UPI00146FAEEF|nr:helix-turn-helix domain-containing protein [Haloechinothrix halophila]